MCSYRELFTLWFAVENLTFPHPVELGLTLTAGAISGCVKAFCEINIGVLLCAGNAHMHKYARAFEALVTILSLTLGWPGASAAASKHSWNSASISASE
jgi:hypothetical protein